MKRSISVVTAWASDHQENLWTLASVLLGCAVWFLVLDADQRDTMRVPFVLTGSGIMLSSWVAAAKTRSATTRELQKTLETRADSAAYLHNASDLLAQTRDLHNRVVEHFERAGVQVTDDMRISPGEQPN